MQDIIITPQSLLPSGEPSIVFTASGDVSPITLNVISGVSPVSGVSQAGSGITSLSFEGTQGQLFSIADNLSSGTLFSVSDIAGLPFMEIDASGDIKLAQFGNSVTTYKPITFINAGINGLSSIESSGNITASGNISTSGSITASGNLGIGTANPEAKLDILGTLDSDGATLTDVSITGEAGSGTNWSGTNIETGYAHTAGSTDPLVTNITGSVHYIYEVTFTVSGLSAGRFDYIMFGDRRVNVYQGSNITMRTIFIRPKNNTDSLELHPRSDFVGTVSIDSIKRLDIGTRDAVVNIRNSAGTVVNEIRTGTGTNAHQSVYIGTDAGSSVTADRNTISTAVGYNALKRLVNGGYNTAIGHLALSSSVSNSYNTAVGANVLTGFNGSSQNTYNTAIGTSLAYNGNFTGATNVLIGNNILADATTAGGNIALGYSPLCRATTAQHNVALGYSALYENTTGRANVAIGYYALKEMTTGSYNIVMGERAGQYYGESSSALTNTNSSIFIGRKTKASGDSQTNQIVIGDEAIGNGSNSVTLGNTSITKTVLNGDVGIDTNSPEAKLHAVATSATDVGVIVEGATSQSANLQEWKDNAGALVASVGADGDIQTSGNLTFNSGGACFVNSDSFIYFKQKTAGVMTSAYLMANTMFAPLSSHNQSQYLGWYTQGRRWTGLYAAHGDFTGNVGVSGTLTVKDSDGNTDFIVNTNGLTNMKSLALSNGITLQSNYYVEWGGSNNRIRGFSGGVGGGRIELIAGANDGTGGKEIPLVARGDGRGGKGAVIMGQNRDTDYHLEVVGSGAMNGIYASGESTFVANTATQTPVLFQGATSQSANLTEWQNSAGDILASVNQRGELNLNTTKVDSAREKLITAKISESDSSFGVANLTSTNALFLPSFYGYNNDDNRSALGFVGIMATAHDDSSTQNGVIDFNVCKVANNSSDPMNESRNPIATKNLLTLRNNATKVLTINKKGFMELTPTATGVAFSIEASGKRATESPIIELIRTSESPATNDSLGQLKFVGMNDIFELVNYATITCKIGDATDGSEDGYIQTKLRKNGGFTAVSNQTSSALQLLDGVGLESDGPITAGGSGIPYSEPITNASGVVNMMIISSGTYDGITPDANTLYFIVDP